MSITGCRVKSLLFLQKGISQRQVLKPPSDYGWLTSRWTSKYAAFQFNLEYGRLFLNIQGQDQSRRMNLISNALQKDDAEYPVFYIDEAGVDLNPTLL